MKKGIRASVLLMAVAGRAGSVHEDDPDLYCDLMRNAFVDLQEHREMLLELTVGK